MELLDCVLCAQRLLVIGLLRCELLYHCDYWSSICITVKCGGEQPKIQNLFILYPLLPFSFLAN